MPTFGDVGGRGSLLGLVVDESVGLYLVMVVW
jgi:hypothetical protein